jgi:molybdopterin synthase catalytic subunit
MNDLIAIMPEALSVGTIVQSVSHGEAGGIAVFLGTTRAEASPDGKPLVALDYEAYADMALAQMQELARRARARWPIERLAILHRVGRVAVGDPSVVIAVATPHRAEAFDACRWIIDTLKAEVAIWKKEVWSDGQTSWVEGRRPQSE